MGRTSPFPLPADTWLILIGESVSESLPSQRTFTLSPRVGRYVSGAPVDTRARAGVGEQRKSSATGTVQNTVYAGLTKEMKREKVVRAFGVLVSSGRYGKESAWEAQIKGEGVILTPEDGLSLV